MNNTSTNSERATPWSGAFFSAKYFLIRALILIALFSVVHLMGWRVHTTFLSGTSGNPDVSLQTSVHYGTIYLGLYLGCVVLAPILLITSAFLALWEKFNFKQ